MALQHNYNYKGIPITNAYHRVSWGQCYKDSAGVFKLKFDVEVSATAGSEVIDVINGSRAFECVYDIASPLNAIAQAYAHLMTLPEFAGAVQV